jgi:glycosyltransferase involved in cell wall biosynthesis
MNRLSVVIITLNEEKNIGRCIDSVKQVADEIVVLDSFSTDRTVAIAREKGAIVSQQQFNGYIRQKNKVLQLALHDYVLSLDADEALSETLINSILEVKKNFSYAGYSMNRNSFFCGQSIRHGLWYPDKKLRLFNKRTAKWGGYDPHDKVMMENAYPVKHLKGELLHFAYYSVAAYLQKNEKISTIAARSLYEEGIRKHWSKVILSPAWEFLNGYFFRLGFLDGYNGLLIAIHTAHQSYLKHVQLQRLQKQSLQQLAGAQMVSPGLYTGNIPKR